MRCKIVRPAYVTQYYKVNNKKKNWFYISKNLLRVKKFHIGQLKP